jgi:hypothetical protein
MRIDNVTDGQIRNAAYGRMQGGSDLYRAPGINDSYTLAADNKSDIGDIIMPRIVKIHCYTLMEVYTRGYFGQTECLFSSCDCCWKRT